MLCDRYGNYGVSPLPTMHSNPTWVQQTPAASVSFSRIIPPGSVSPPTTTTYVLSSPTLNSTLGPPSIQPLTISSQWYLPARPRLLASHTPLAVSPSPYGTTVSLPLTSAAAPPPAVLVREVPDPVPTPTIAVRPTSFSTGSSLSDPDVVWLDKLVQPPGDTKSFTFINEWHPIHTRLREQGPLPEPAPASAMPPASAVAQQDGDPKQVLRRISPDPLPRKASQDTSGSAGSPPFDPSKTVLKLIPFDRPGPDLADAKTPHSEEESPRTQRALSEPPPAPGPSERRPSYVLSQPRHSAFIPGDAALVLSGGDMLRLARGPPPQEAVRPAAVLATTGKPAAKRTQPRSPAKPKPPPELMGVAAPRPKSAFRAAGPSSNSAVSPVRGVGSPSASAKRAAPPVVTQPAGYKAGSLRQMPGQARPGAAAVRPISASHAASRLAGNSTSTRPLSASAVANRTSARPTSPTIRRSNATTAPTRQPVTVIRRTATPASSAKRPADGLPTAANRSTGVFGATQSGTASKSGGVASRVKGPTGAATVHRSVGVAVTKPGRSTVANGSVAVARPVTRPLGGSAPSTSKLIPSSWADSNNARSAGAYPTAPRSALRTISKPVPPRALFTTGAARAGPPRQVPARPAPGAVPKAPKGKARPQPVRPKKAAEGSVDPKGKGKAPDGMLPPPRADTVGSPLPKVGIGAWSFSEALGSSDGGPSSGGALVSPPSPVLRQLQTPSPLDSDASISTVSSSPPERASRPTTGPVVPRLQLGGLQNGAPLHPSHYQSQGSLDTLDNDSDADFDAPPNAHCAHAPPGPINITSDTLKTQEMLDRAAYLGFNGGSVALPSWSG